MIKSSRFLSQLGVFLVLNVIFAMPVLAAKENTQKPITLVLNDWSSQLVLTHITAELLQQLGYQTKFVTKTSNAQWGSLGRGLSHIQMEVWQGTMENMYTSLIDKGVIIDAGTHDAVTREEWWYPLYVEEVCPGLPHWEALKKCAHLFATAQTNGQGRYLGGPWEKPDAARIRALGLNFQVVKVKSGDDLWPELARAVQAKQPIVLFNWTPNWVEAKYQGRFIEFPDYHPDCETDPKWGVNASFLYDCGNPKQGWLKKVVWHGFEKNWPCAFKLINNVNFNNQMLSDLAYAVDGKGLAYKEAASQWLAQHAELWKSWIPNNCQI